MSPISINRHFNRRNENLFWLEWWLYNTVSHLQGAGNTGVHDTVVNQLLSKIDGVDQLNNILVIGEIFYSFLEFIRCRRFCYKNYYSTIDAESVGLSPTSDWFRRSIRSEAKHSSESDQIFQPGLIFFYSSFSFFQEWQIVKTWSMKLCCGPVVWKFRWRLVSGTRVMQQWDDHLTVMF